MVINIETIIIFWISSIAIERKSASSQVFSKRNLIMKISNPIIVGRFYCILCIVLCIVSYIHIMHIYTCDCIYDLGEKNRTRVYFLLFIGIAWHFYPWWKWDSTYYICFIKENALKIDQDPFCTLCWNNTDLQGVLHFIYVVIFGDI